MDKILRFQTKHAKINKINTISIAQDQKGRFKAMNLFIFGKKNSCYNKINDSKAEFSKIP